jgi:carboxyl-terminal processing protease
LNKKTAVAIGAILSVMLIFIVFAGGIVLGRKLENTKHPEWQTPYDLSKAQHMMALIDKDYVDKVNMDKLKEGAVQGIVDALNDPFTNYFNTKSYKSFTEDMNGSFSGVGIIFQQDKKTKELIVVEPIEGSPAEKAGVKAKDVIVKINSEPTKGMNQDTAVGKIKGKVGTQVTLSMRRDNAKKLIDFKLIRAEIILPNVTSKMLKNKIGYVRIHDFNAKTSDKLVEKYNTLLDQDMRGLILDLRGNPGGILDEAVRVGSVWIDKGVIVSIKRPRTGDTSPEYALGGADTKTPVVVLVDKYSASASEIVSGALQDYERAILIGETTFGKACVQTVTPLDDGSGISLTTDYYYTPKGRMIHKKGIRPDIVVKADAKSKEDVQMKKATEVIEELISGKRKLKKAS